MYCIFDTIYCLDTKIFFFAFNIMDCFITQLYCINHTIKLFPTSRVRFQQTIYCHLRTLFNNNVLYHSNIMMGYYNQCAFYCVTINCIEPKNDPNQTSYCINSIMIQNIFLRNQLTPVSITKILITFYPVFPLLPE